MNKKYYKATYRTVDGSVKERFYHSRNPATVRSRINFLVDFDVLISLVPISEEEFKRGVDNTPITKKMVGSLVNTRKR